ncbi:MAG: alpha/beta hydrolase [Lachnospiraceae bacterium]
MRYETIEIELDYKALGMVHDDSVATATTYLLDIYPEYQRLSKRPLVIICPGGGYNHHSPREGEAIAIRMNSFGCNAIVLRYSLAPNEYPCALYELAATVAMARNHAKEWNIDTDKIIVAGFSAGGHLAASFGNHWSDEKLTSALGVDSELLRPNGQFLGYPVITSGEYAHRGSFEKLLGTHGEELMEQVSVEKTVNKNTPPTFLWHTFEDGSVPVENSLLMAKALREQGIHFEMHIFPYGGHGLGLATEETNTREGNKLQPECAVWPDLFATWLGNLK